MDRRETGIAHPLLELRTKEDILGHPVARRTRETLVLETPIAAVPDGTAASFYRTSAGAEIDLVLRFPCNRLWAIEVKWSSAPKVEKRFHFDCEDLRPKKRFVVYPGTERFSLGNRIEAIGLVNLATEIRSAK